jgi:dipeptidyl aminopeptidase/acylaminoacyl peptidase
VTPRDLKSRFWLSPMVDEGGFTGRRPVVIDIHGGPEGQSRPDFNGRDNFLINELGVAILSPNVRGSTGYGKSFQKLDRDAAGPGLGQDHGVGRKLRRVHDPGRGHPLRRCS